MRGRKAEIFFRTEMENNNKAIGTEKYFIFRAVIYSVVFVPCKMRHGFRRRGGRDFYCLSISIYKSLSFPVEMLIPTSAIYPSSIVKYDISSELT